MSFEARVGLESGRKIIPFKYGNGYKTDQLILRHYESDVMAKKKKKAVWFIQYKVLQYSFILVNGAKAACLVSRKGVGKESL